MHPVRQATTSDASAISTLVLSLVGASLVDAEGEQAKNFYATLAPSEVANGIAMPNRFYAVVEVQGQVHGMIMVRDANYVGQFFVRSPYQGRGMGSALWRFALAHSKQLGGSGAFMVRSSVAAEPIYRRFGFVATGAVEVQQGFRFIAMHREADIQT